MGCSGAKADKYSGTKEAETRNDAAENTQEVSPAAVAPASAPTVAETCTSNAKGQVVTVEAGGPEILHHSLTLSEEGVDEGCRQRVSIRGHCLLGGCECPGFTPTRANEDLCRLCDHAKSLHTKILSESVEEEFQLHD